MRLFGLTPAKIRSKFTAGFAAVSVVMQFEHYDLEWFEFLVRLNFS